VSSKAAQSLGFFHATTTLRLCFSAFFFELAHEIGFGEREERSRFFAFKSQNQFQMTNTKQSPTPSDRHVAAQGAAVQPQSDPTPQVLEALTLFTERFAPAIAVAQATHFYSTEELLRAISALLPGYTMPAAAAVVGYLQDRDYRFDIPQGQFSLEYKWLLIER